MNKELFLSLFADKKDQKQEKEKFKPGTCLFENNSNLDPINVLTQNNFFGHIEIENLCFLFSKMPVFYFDNANKQECPQDNVFKELYFMVCVYDIYNWCCHQAAPFFSVKNRDWEYVIGFASQKMSSGKTCTFLHSFNVRGETFVDPTIQARYAQQVKWVQKGIWGNTGFVPDDFHSYMGIKFPVNLANKIVFGKEGVVGNTWGFLLKEVLCSKETTERFIKELGY